MVTLLVSWDAPSLIRPAAATIRATTQSGPAPPGGNHVEAAYRSPCLNAYAVASALPRASILP